VQSEFKTREEMEKEKAKAKAKGSPSFFFSRKNGI